MLLLVVAPIVGFCVYSIFIVHCFVSFLAWQSLFDRKEKAGCFILFVYMVSCDCSCSVAHPLQCVIVVISSHTY